MKDAKMSRTARMFQLVLEGKSNEAAVEIIKKEYGKNVPTNTASIGWCRTQLKAKTKYAKKHNPRGLKVISNREAIAKKSASAKPAAKPVAKPAAKPATTQQARAAA